MAGFVSKTLLRHATTASASKSLKVTPCIISCRHRSSQATKPQLIEIDLSSSSSYPATSLSHDEYEVALKLFDDFIQRMLVKKATPDWLPFVPGSSFWVPPRSSPSPSNVANLIEKFTKELSDEDFLSVATLRGWPCSEFFFKENESAHGGDTGVNINSPKGMEVTVQVKVLTILDNVAHSEDEEG